MRKKETINYINIRHIGVPISKRSEVTQKQPLDRYSTQQPTCNHVTEVLLFFLITNTKGKDILA